MNLQLLLQEMKTLREQLRQNNDQTVQHISEFKNTITTNISSHSKITMEQLEGMQLDFAKRDDDLTDKIQSNQVSLMDEVQEQNKAVIGTIEREKGVQQMNHVEHIGHLFKTERSILSKTEETTADILTHVKQTGQEIMDKVDNISVGINETSTIEAAKSVKQGTMLV